MSATFWIVIVGIACFAVWLILRWHNRSLSVEVYTPHDESVHLAKLKPYFRREIVEAKVKSSFPNRNPAEILNLLDNDLPSFWGLERLQLDILKLSNGDLDQLLHYIEVARSGQDCMSVISLAEHPESSRRTKHDKGLFWGEHKKEIEKDFRQYLNWLKKH